MIEKETAKPKQLLISDERNALYASNMVLDAKLTVRLIRSRKSSERIIKTKAEIIEKSTAARITSSKAAQTE